MLEDFINAFGNFRSKKLRTVLSLLGIAIGVTVVTVISNIGSSMKVSMAKLFNLDTMNMIQIEPRWDFDKQKYHIKLTEKYRNALEKNVPLVKDVFYSDLFNATVSHNSFYLKNQRIVGIEYEAKVLFPEGNAIGKRVTLTVPYNQGRQFIPFSFEVCGVVKPRNRFSSIGSFMVPRSFVAEDMGIGKNDSSIASVQIYDPAYIDEATAQIKAFSDSFAKAENTLWTFSEKDILNQINSQIALISVVLIVIAVMSLIVGGINIMNIMLVTVTERKKEIGIRKALGASEAVIRNQFLVESATLSLTGGIFGMLLGGGLSMLLVQTVFQSDNFKMVFSPNISGSVIAFAVSITIGIFFGLRPAVKAARLDPVKALAD